MMVERITNTPLELHFPRWVPGSYMIREPFKYVREITIEDDQGQPVKWRRTGVDGIRISAREKSTTVIIRYRVLCPELSVRSNHLDASHLHLMPPFTWFLPKSGCEWTSNNGAVTITLNLPSEWTIATQQAELSGQSKIPNHSAWKCPRDCTSSQFYAKSRDELLDGVFEANSNVATTTEIMGVTHHLKMWDAGGYPIEEEAIARIEEALEKIVTECYSLFGVPEINSYTTILHLTGSLRGGLEHMRSQTSMVPREALWPDAKAEWRDLVSLLAHEYVHFWNVKNLRPKKFLDYDLSYEQTTDLLWWFEGGTSWLGDVICVRSGVWSEEDYRIDFKRKYERHLKGSGHELQSLAESSHEAWIHLYRQHQYSSEYQISYYNDAELALFCLDAEMRRRSKGRGIEQVFVELFHLHHLDSEEAGVDENAIKRAIGRCDGGARLGGIVDTLIHSRQRPDIGKAMQTFGLTLVNDKKDQSKGDTKDNETNPAAWLGIGLSENGNNVVIDKIRPDSPLRDIAIPHDELIAVDGLRVSSQKILKKILKGKCGQTISLLLSRQGSVMEFAITAGEKPLEPTKISGVGNRLWQALICSQSHE